MLKNKTAIITGARGNIGFATVEAFAANGASLIWACARKNDCHYENKLFSLSDKYGTRILPAYFDITDEFQIKSFARQIGKEKVGVDVLVNVAGAIAESSSIHMTSIRQMQSIFDVNFFGVTCLTQYISRLMVRKCCGNIVNVSSVAALDGTPGEYEYVSSKAALIGATKKLAMEFSKYNIRCNAVAPGIIQSGMEKSISDELREETLKKTILKRMGNASEVANVIAFLASDLSSYINAQVIRVDGGM